MAEDMRLMSRRVWDGDESTVETINCGSLQRIADACELMAKNYASLIAERDRYKQWYEDYRHRVEERDRTIAALRGHITRLRNGAPPATQEAEP